MHSIDQRIQTALSAEDQHLLAQYRDDLNIFSEIAISFRGVRGYLTMLVWVLMFVWAGLFVFCAYKFFGSQSLDEKLAWMGGGIMCFLTMIIMKLWYFMDMNRNTFMREFKRLELQISLLAEKLQ